MTQKEDVSHTNAISASITTDYPGNFLKAGYDYGRDLKC